jgi:colicin import membrane protein
MSTRSFGAYFVSALLHSLVVALILFLAFLAHETSNDAPKVFELVAGAGDNYAATEAPALGVPGGKQADATPESQSVTFTAPPEAPPVPEPVITETVPPDQAVQQEQSPVTPAPVPAHPAKAKPKPKSDAVPNFSRTVQRIENKRAARLMAKYKKELEAEQRREQMSYDEYVRKHGSGRESAEGIAGGVVGGSRGNKIGGAGGKALTREQGELLDGYFALLKARIRENLVPPPEVSDKIVTVVGFDMTAGGFLSHIHIVHSSGNADFDRAVLEAFAHTHSIGPRPDGRSEGDLTLRVGLRDEEGE